MVAAVGQLKELGFSEYEAKAYTALLGENPLTAYEIAKNSGIPTSKVYEVIRRLEVKHIVQPIYGERSKMFVPLSPDEFVQNYKATVEDSLSAVRDKLKDVKSGMDRSYTLHIKEYENFTMKAKRMIDRASNTILLMAWPAETDRLLFTLIGAQERGIKIAFVHYGATNIRIQKLYRHPVEETIYAEKKVRGFSLVADAQEALNAKISGQDSTDAIWSMNEGFVMMAEDYIRHDIYLMRTIQRLDPAMRKHFGEKYEKLLNIFEEEDAHL